MIDRALVNMDLHDRQLLEVEVEIARQVEAHAAAQVIHTIPGAAAVTSLAIGSRIGSIDRFPRPASLSNFFGLAPVINDTGESTGRLGSITKRGNSTVRFLLGQLVYHVTRKDEELRRWYRKIRKRRGPKTAMVAVMRRITLHHLAHVQDRRDVRIGSRPCDLNVRSRHGEPLDQYLMENHWIKRQVGSTGQTSRPGCR